MMVAGSAPAVRYEAQLHPETMRSAVDLCNTSALCVAMRQQLTEDVGRGAVAEAETGNFVSVVPGQSQSRVEESTTATKAQTGWTLRYIGQLQSPLN